MKRETNIWNLFALLAVCTLLLAPMVMAADKTPIVQSDATRGAVEAFDGSTDTLALDGALDLDDGTGDSPSLSFTDADDNTLTILKLDAGGANIVNDEGAINLQASGDTDDYLTLSTVSDVPVIGTAGGANLKITSDSGTIDMDDDNLTTTGTITSAGGLGLRSISENLTYDEFTDNTDATGYVDLATQLPAGAIPVGWKAVVNTGFTGDTTAVCQVGGTSDLDRFSAVTDQSVLAAATVGASALGQSDSLDGINAAQTIRVTVTGAADFTSISAGDMDITVYYIVTQ